MSDQFDQAQVGRVMEIHDKMAKVDLGGGTMINVNITFVNARQGDFVLVHAGYAISVLNLEEADRMLAHWRQAN
jgi:hydrogenase expression/formation protein HypC